MKIKYITAETLDEIKTNYKIIYRDVVKNRSKTIQEFFKNNSIVKESGIEAEDFELVMSDENPINTDIHNIKRVYQHMLLSESQAADERIWTAYAFSEFSDYMYYRWKINDAENMMNRYLFNYGVHRSLFRNGIARLWWIGRITYDKRRNDPFELTEFICRDQDYVNQLLDIGFSNNTEVARAVISALYDAEQEGYKIGRESVRETSKYVNLLAGTYIIDALNIQWIYDKVKAKILN